VRREAGLIRVHRAAQQRWYELRPVPLAEIDAWIEPYRWLWTGQLDALGGILISSETGFRW